MAIKQLMHVSIVVLLGMHYAVQGGVEEDIKSAIDRSLPQQAASFQSTELYGYAQTIFPAVVDVVAGDTDARADDLYRNWYTEQIMKSSFGGYTRAAFVNRLYEAIIWGFQNSAALKFASGSQLLLQNFYEGLTEKFGQRFMPFHGLNIFEMAKRASNITPWSQESVPLLRSTVQYAPHASGGPVSDGVRPVVQDSKKEMSFEDVCKTWTSPTSSPWTSATEMSIGSLQAHELLRHLKVFSANTGCDSAQQDRAPVRDENAPADIFRFGKYFCIEALRDKPLDKTQRAALRAAARALTEDQRSLAAFIQILEEQFTITPVMLADATGNFFEHILADKIVDMRSVDDVEPEAQWSAIRQQFDSESRSGISRVLLDILAAYALASRLKGREDLAFALYEVPESTALSLFGDQSRDDQATKFVQKAVGWSFDFSRQVSLLAADEIGQKSPHVQKRAKQLLQQAQAGTVQLLEPRSPSPQESDE